MIGARRTFYVIAYDISDNRRRLKAAKLLDSLGFRVQGSVFEGYLTNQEIERLIRSLKRVLDLETDSLRLYPLCESCREKVTLLGDCIVNEPPDSVVII